MHELTFLVAPTWADVTNADFKLKVVFKREVDGLIFSADVEAQNDPKVPFKLFTYSL